MTAKRQPDSRAANRWHKARRAYAYASARIAERRPTHRFAIDHIDLVLVSNFKGGNASIAEPLEALEDKLKAYNACLLGIAEGFKEKHLRDLKDPQVLKLCDQAFDFLQLTLSNATKIDGFGPSYASALLNIYFPDLLPILDRRVLLAAGAPHVQVNSQRQIRKIEQHYSWLIQETHRRLKRNTKLTMSQLDFDLFSTELPGPKRKRRR
jgi:hypothetical protein